jgi:hypothetical protein
VGCVHRDDSSASIVPQHNDGLLKQVTTSKKQQEPSPSPKSSSNKTQRGRRGSVTEVKVDLMALKEEEEAKVGGQRKQDSAVMQRRRRRASVNLVE